MISLREFPQHFRNWRYMGKIFGSSSLAFNCIVAFKTHFIPQMPNRTWGMQDKGGEFTPPYECLCALCFTPWSQQRCRNSPDSARGSVFNQMWYTSLVPTRVDSLRCPWHKCLKTFPLIQWMYSLAGTNYWVEAIADFVRNALGAATLEFASTVWVFLHLII